MDPTTFRMMSGITGPPPPSQITFTASNYYPGGYGSTTLSWNVTNAASVSINQDIGAVASSGSNTQSGYNNESRTYTLSAVGLDGLNYSASVTVNWANWFDYCPYNYGDRWAIAFC